MKKIALAIHGGAGTIRKSLMTPELESEYRSGLTEALTVGYEVLQKGGDALDAAQAAVCSLEDFHLFNAGRGAVFTHEGKNELDASIMDGRTLKAGAIAFARNIKNPIKLARLVMERTQHIMLAGEGANSFAELMGVERAPDEYFFTELRWEQLLKAREEGVVQLDHTIEEPALIKDSERPENESVSGAVATGAVDTQHSGVSPSEKAPPATAGGTDSSVRDPKSLGTVGAVACDSDGNLAAATSTGGMTNKKFGRVGDTPLIGSGTYADNATCAVSCTGHGEYFMLGVTAYDVAARMKYKGVTLEQAAHESIDYLTSIGGEGGLIAVDAAGNVTLPFNSDGMYRGFVTTDHGVRVEIYR